MSERFYGTAALVGDTWVIEAEPHVTMTFKRVMPALARQFGTLKFGHTASNAELLEWILVRFPLDMSNKSKAELFTKADASRSRRRESIKVLEGKTKLRDLGTLLPLRDYQMLGIELLLLKEGLLIGDDIGLGKTAIALGAIAAGLSPAIIVCKTSLQLQWVEEAKKFLENVKCHIVKQTKEYDFPEHNVLVITYSKLAAWSERLEGYALIAFDEAQELRRDESAKYMGAKHLAAMTANRLGLTATPIYNYGDEIYNIVDLLTPEALGSKAEFLEGWCVPIGMNKHKVVDTNALGSFLAENHLFLRRRRKEVGRELPPISKIVEEVEYDEKGLRLEEDRCLQLAQTILSGSWEERGKAALEIDWKMRQATGLAKAPFVAEFVKDLVESGPHEGVVLCGWHREVYIVWQRILERFGVKSVMYTGSESPTQKNQAKLDFIEGRADVFIMSLRSGRD